MAVVLPSLLMCSLWRLSGTTCQENNLCFIYLPRHLLNGTHSLLPARWPSCRDWIAADGQLIDGQEVWLGSNCCCRVMGCPSWSHPSCSLQFHFESQKHQPAVLSGWLGENLLHPEPDIFTKDEQTWRQRCLSCKETLVNRKTSKQIDVYRQGIWDCLTIPGHSKSHRVSIPYLLNSSYHCLF